MHNRAHSTKGNALEQRWQRLLAKLQAIALLLATQGTLVPKTGRARLNWCVRYLDRPHLRGKPVRRMIYVGSDPELVRRTAKYLEHCRAHVLETKESLRLARFAMTMGSRVRRQMQSWVGSMALS
jgi:hypothetical protein